MTKRRLLATTVGLFFTFAVVALAIILSASLAPSKEKAVVEIDINSIPIGTYQVREWKNKPVGIFRPSSENLADLRKLTSKSLHKVPVPPTSQIYVYYLQSTNRGCGLVHAPKHASPKAIGSSEDPLKWQGGFYDPCHYGEWDYAGRAISVYDIYDGLPDLYAPKFRITNGMVRLF
jgi:Rieske Fe-S protein